MPSEKVEESENERERNVWDGDKRKYRRNASKDNKREEGNLSDNVRFSVCEREEKVRKILIYRMNIFVLIEIWFTWFK